jgi:hypothetical protein
MQLGWEVINIYRSLVGKRLGKRSLRKPKRRWKMAIKHMLEKYSMLVFWGATRSKYFDNPCQSAGIANLPTGEQNFRNQSLWDFHAF